MRSYSSLCVCMCILSLKSFECLNQTLRNLVFISWHMNAYQRRNKRIPPISNSYKHHSLSNS
jgi:hypothetical protein